MRVIEETPGYWRAVFDYPPFNVVDGDVFQALQDLLVRDMRFASRENTKLGHPELGVGLHPGGGGTERLPHLVGRGRALEIVLGANDFDGDTAERYGYVNRSLPDAELDGFVDALARR